MERLDNLRVSLGGVGIASCSDLYFGKDLEWRKQTQINFPILVELS